MVKKVHKKSVGENLFDSLKKKVVSLGIEYLRKNLQVQVEDVFKNAEVYLKRKVERRIRYEVRRQVFNFLVVLFLFLGIGFLVYFLIDLMVLYLEIPVVFTNLLFGLFLILFSLVLYVQR